LFEPVSASTSPVKRQVKRGAFEILAESFLTTDGTDKMNFSEPIRVIRGIRGSLLSPFLSIRGLRLAKPFT
jgi:hypothetical protein